MTDPPRTATEYKYLQYETHDEGTIARIVLDRVKYRNAQNRGGLLVELDEAFARAEADDTVRVVILAGNGPVFSSGHDLGSPRLSRRARPPRPGPALVLHVHRRHQGRGRIPIPPGVALLLRQHPPLAEPAQDHRRRGPRQRLLRRAHAHLGMRSDRRRRGTQFADVVATRLGMCGVEYFGHPPWEFGPPRKAKELLLTGDSLDAEDARALGMVSKVFPPADTLTENTLAFARRIAQVPSMAALLVKESVNQSQDAMGFSSALDACFTIHQLNHAQWTHLSGGKTVVGTPELGLPDWKTAPPPITRADPHRP